MSEIATESAAPVTESAAPVTESAPSGPQSTQDIAASVIQSAEEDAQIEAAPEQAAAPEPKAEPAPKAPEKELSEVEQLLKDAGYNERNETGQYNRIPYPRVKQMIENGLKRGQARWEGEKTALESQKTQLEQHIEKLREGVMGDEEAFLREIATVNPKFQRFLQPQQAPTAAAFDAEMPQPDFALPDGSRTYSLDGIQKQLIPWLTDAITKQLESKVDAKLEPLTKRERQIEQQAQIERTTRKQMDDAQTWPMFGTLTPGKETPFQSEVLAELRKDSEQARAEGRRPTMSLRQAYLEVYARHQEPDKIRARVMAEINAAPRGTATARTGIEPTRAPGPRSTADIARHVASQLEAGR